MSFVTTKPPGAGDRNLGIGWPTAALVSQWEPSGSVAVLIVCQDGRRASRSGPTPRYGRGPRR